GNCGATLAAGANCQIQVAYTPTVTGLHTDTVQVDYNDGVSAQNSQRDLQGTGVLAGFLTITDGPTYDYGTIAVGASADHTFTISNTGGATATAMNSSALTAPFSYKGGTYPGTGGNCSASLNAAANCTIVVTYAPAGAGVHSDTIQINYNNSLIVTSSTRDIQGTGATPASLAISDGPTYNYGNLAVGLSADKTFTVTNSGGVSASSVSAGTLTAPFSYKGGVFPGTGGTCTAIIPGLGNCTIVVTYSPTATGVHSDTISLNYNDGIGAQNTTRDIQGSSATLAVITISDAVLYDYGTQPLGSNTDHTFNLNNTGGVPATALAGTGLAAPFSYKGGSYPGTGGSCGATLNNGVSCSIVVTYSPTAPGLHADTIQIDYNDGSSVVNATRDVQGTGASAAFLAVSDGPFYDYGTKANGSTTDYTFTVDNTGSIAATTIAGSGLVAPFTFKGGSYPGTGGSCASSLAAGSNCTIVVTYAPTVSGLHNDTIQLDYNDGLAPQTSTRDVQGTGAAPALLSISDGPTYDYGTRAIGAAVDHSFTVDNLGGITATAVNNVALTAPFSFKGGTYPGTGGNCGATLAAGSSCTMVVTYSPASSGLHTDTVQLDYNNGVNSQSSTRPVQGTGASLGFLTLSDGPTFDYGTQATGSATDHTFVVNNTGGVTTTGMAGSGLIPPFAFKGGSYPGTGGNCTTTLAPAGTCNIVVTYSPTASGAHADTIILDYNDGVAAQSVTGDVQGTGAAAAVLAISDGPTYDFGTFAVGSSNDYTFTVNNTGGVTAAGISGTGLAAPFTFKGGSYPGTGGTCGASLAGGGSCTLVVNYSPTATGVHTDTIQLDYNNGASAQNSLRDIQGTATSPALIAISDGPTYDFGPRALGSTLDKAFTLSNSGGVPATSVAGSGLAAPFEFKGGSYPGLGGTCGATIANGANCTVVVSFTPTAPGLASDTFDIDYNDG
ncbi:MAG: choice-of-anchor D domain-containing protein, partial [Bdellovibrionales bacterium]|nr:choice-of-anchor D domain-containing protein [Bdellovibrionales bacterium]